MENYFKLTAEKKVNLWGATLFRIELTIDCKWGKKGDKGGWVESEFLSNGGARVSGGAWVSGDAWEQSPLQIQGTKHFFNICMKGFLQIGCIKKTFKEWKEEFEKVGKEAGYTDEQIKEYGLYIDLAIAIYGNKEV